MHDANWNPLLVKPRYMVLEQTQHSDNELYTAALHNKVGPPHMYVHVTVK